MAVFQSSVARRVGEAGRGRLLDDFLVAALGGAIAFAESHDVAFAITEELHFDVAAAGDVFFEEEAGVFEIVAGKPLDALVHGREFGFGGDELQPDAAAACGAFQHDGIADAGGFLAGVVEVADKAGAGSEGHAGGKRQFAGFVLQAERAHLVRRWADEGDTSVGAAFSEVRIFGEEAVAGVNGLCAGFACDFQDALDVEIALRGGGGADAHGFRRQRDVARVTIGFRIDCDARNAHFVERTDDAAGNGAAVGDQNFLEHGHAPASQMRTSTGVGL